MKSLIDHSSNQGESIVQTLSNTKISPVFTAHPTNFNKPEASAIVLSQLDDIASPHGNAKVCQELWETQGVRNLKPTVQDEARQFSSNIRHLHSSGRTIHKYINQQRSINGSFKV
ncbi:phosphoenolpyruvate carboxylase [Mycobacterium tuberculosis]|uniref:phosphoenolpyruvate carboxylase n=1 Tax=Mycobacterium tuberculosis TaxID=1773 RepID=UPI00350EEFF2